MNSSGIWSSASNRMLARANRMRFALQEREAAGRPVRVAVIGAGEFGQTLVAQLSQIAGARASLVCDLDPERAIAAYVEADLSREDVAAARTLAEAEERVTRDRPTVVDDLELAVRAPVEVVVDCTGEPEVGCRVALGAIEQGRHVVMVNVEADATAGVQLAARARRAGVVYTLADGDQPSLIVGLIDWARCLGLQVVCAGKWTHVYPPEVVAARLQAEKNPSKTTVTYLDGSKTQIEMASAANAGGLTVDVPGMHGPSLRLHEIPGALCPDGGLLGRGGVVEYVNCLSPAGEVIEETLGGGVFVVVTSGSRRAMRAMAGKEVIASADGRYALLYRPYHLVGVETPWSILEAALEGVPTAAPGPEALVEVVAMAKTDLRAGVPLGGLGAADVRGIAVPAGEAVGTLPVGLAEGVRLRTDAPAGTWLTVGMVGERPDSTGWRLAVAL
jgi:predicted homoserine dehydrogenase-like protein